MRISTTPSSANPNRNRPRESGVALLLAISLMTATILFGLVTVEISTQWTDAEQTRSIRTSARHLAEGGLDAMLQRLTADPNYSQASTTKIDGWTLNLAVSQQPGYVEVESIATDGAVALGYAARLAKMGGTLPQGVAVAIGGGVEVQSGSTFKWSGGLQTVHGLAVDGTSETSGRHETGTFQDWGILADSFGSQAETSHRDGTVLNRNKNEGLHYGAGDLTIESKNYRFDGTFGVAGNLTFDGEGKTVEIASGELPVSLLVGGTLTFRNISLLELSGAVYVGGDIVFENVEEAQLYSAGGASGNVLLGNSIVAWEYDPELAIYNPPWVSGQNGTVEFVEEFRKSFAP